MLRSLRARLAGAPHELPHVAASSMIRAMVNGASWLRFLATTAALSVAACSSPPSEALRQISGFAQGTSYSLQWSGAATEAEIAAAAEQELERIDALLSNYRPDSSLERFNAARSTEAQELPAELMSLLGLAKRMQAASDGCFDPTVRPLVRAWGFDRDTPAVPPPEAIAAARAVVGLDKLELIDATQARKTHADLEVDMASIGQGYTVARLAALLEQHGSTSYLAEIGGEIVARGTKPDQVPWRIGIERPVADASIAAAALRVPEGAATAVITSGSYRHHFEVDGRQYSHIIDPRSGWPVEHSLLSVTVVGADATSTAAWATALLCLGPVAAMNAAARENVAALLWIGGGGAGVTLERTPSFESQWSAYFDGPPAGR